MKCVSVQVKVIHLTVGNTSSIRAGLQLKSTINCCSQVLGFSGESQFSSSPLFSGGEWLLAATLPSPAQIPLICHTCPTQTSIPLPACFTNYSLRLHLWEEEHHSSQVHKPQDKQHSTSYDWTKPGLFLTAQSSAQSGVGGCSHWRNVLWYWMHKSSWTIPLWGYSQSYLLGIRTASQHSHTQTTEHYFS